MDKDLKIKGLIKKQDLIKEYVDKIHTMEQASINIDKKIRVIKKRFSDLIKSTPDLEQLELFENLEQILTSDFSEGDIDKYLIDTSDKTI